eukprot:8098718-Alexandrium_andersonii.AAC.1
MRVLRRHTRCASAMRRGRRRRGGWQAPPAPPTGASGAPEAPVGEVRGALAQRRSRSRWRRQPG